MLEFDVGSSEFYPAKEVEAMLSGAPATLASIVLEGVATLRIYLADPGRAQGKDHRLHNHTRKGRGHRARPRPGRSERHVHRATRQTHKELRL